MLATRKADLTTLRLRSKFKKKAATIVAAFLSRPDAGVLPTIAVLTSKAIRISAQEA